MPTGRSTQIGQRLRVDPERITAPDVTSPKSSSKAFPAGKLTISRAPPYCQCSVFLVVGMTREQISELCMVSLAHVLRIPKDTIEANAKFTRLGLDSAMVVYLMMELEEKLGLELSPDDFYDYPTVNDLSRYLAEKQAKRSAA
jgi:acyl carrier protein